MVDYYTHHHPSSHILWMWEEDTRDAIESDNSVAILACWSAGRRLPQEFRDPQLWAKLDALVTENGPTWAERLKDFIDTRSWMEQCEHAADQLEAGDLTQADQDILSSQLLAGLDRVWCALAAARRLDREPRGLEKELLECNQLLDECLPLFAGQTAAARLMVGSWRPDLDRSESSLSLFSGFWRKIAKIDRST